MVYSSKKSIILFDGICNFCNSSVNFILKHDNKDFFRFVPIQSQAGEWICSELCINPLEENTLVLYERGEIYTHSSATLKIAKNLSGLWPMLYGFYYFPAFIRDFLYKMIAKKRYRLFGKRSSCMIPKPEQKHKFIIHAQDFMDM